MINLFNALKFSESGENQYIMRCIMQVLGVADITPDIARYCIAELTSMPAGISKNPRNPVFKHYLIESVVVLFRRACENDLSLIPTFECSIFPLIQIILPNDLRFQRVPIRQPVTLC